MMFMIGLKSILFFTAVTPYFELPKRSSRVGFSLRPCKSVILPVVLSKKMPIGTLGFSFGFTCLKYAYKNCRFCSKSALFLAVTFNVLASSFFQNSLLLILDFVMVLKLKIVQHR